MFVGRLFEQAERNALHVDDDAVGVRESEDGVVGGDIAGKFHDEAGLGAVVADADGGDGRPALLRCIAGRRERHSHIAAQGTGRKRVAFLLDRIILLNGGFAELFCEKIGKFVGGSGSGHTGDEAQGGNQAETRHPSAPCPPVKLHIRRLVPRDPPDLPPKPAISERPGPRPGRTPLKRSPCPADARHILSGGGNGGAKRST